MPTSDANSTPNLRQTISTSILTLKKNVGPLSSYGGNFSSFLTSDDEHARALEEQWIDSIDNAGTASLSQASSASNSTVLQGILLGFFFPLLPFFFMRSSKPPVFWDDGSEHEPTSNVVFS